MYSTDVSNAKRKVVRSDKTISIWTSDTNIIPCLPHCPIVFEGINYPKSWPRDRFCNYQTGCHRYINFKQIPRMLWSFFVHRCFLRPLPKANNDLFRIMLQDRFLRDGRFCQMGNLQIKANQLNKGTQYLKNLPSFGKIFHWQRIGVVWKSKMIGLGLGNNYLTSCYLIQTVCSPTRRAGISFFF